MNYHYIKIATRNLMRNKVYTLINVSGLAMGLACCFVILIFVRSELGYDLENNNRESLYRLTLDVKTLNSGFTWTSATSSILWAPQLVKDYPEIESFSRIFAARPRFFKVNEIEIEQENFVYGDENALELFDWTLLYGDPQSALYEPYSVIINESVANTYFGDTNPIGKILTSYDPQGQDSSNPLWDIQYTVTGVMKDIGYKSHLKPDMVLSFRTLNDVYNADVTAGVAPEAWYWRGRVVHNYLQLSDQASVEELEAKLQVFLDRVVGDSTTSRGYQYFPYLQRLDTIHLEGNVENTLERGGDKDQLILFSTVAFFILAVACINFTNLSTARSSSRAREIGIRKVVGAHRYNLVSQFLGESFFLTLIAMILGIGIAYFVNPVFYSYIAQDFNLSMEDLPTIATSILAITVITGLLSGGYPALYLANLKPVSSLETRFSLAGKGKTLSKLLVIMQFAITIFFIFATFTVYSQRQYMQSQELGVKTENIVVIPPAVNRPLIRQIESLSNELKNVSGVRGVTVSNGVPGMGGGSGDTWGERGKIGEAVISFDVEYAVDYDYLGVYGLELLAGRNFNREMVSDAAPLSNGPGYQMAGIVNEAAVSQFGWGEPGNALGKRIIRDPISNDYTVNIIGVVRDYHYNSLQNQISPMVLYINPNVSRNTRAVSLELERDNIADTLLQVREIYAAYSNEIAFDYEFVDQAFGEQYSSEQRMIEIFSYIALLTIFIACLGLFGLASFAARQRTKEIGIRKVLGAAIENLVVLITMDFVKLIGLSALIAFPIAYIVMSNWLQDFAYRYQIGIGTFAFAGLLALCIAVFTVGSQALKAALVNPSISLKCD